MVDHTLGSEPSSTEGNACRIRVDNVLAIGRSDDSLKFLGPESKVPAGLISIARFGDLHAPVIGRVIAQMNHRLAWVVIAIIDEEGESVDGVGEGLLPRAHFLCKGVVDILLEVFSRTPHTRLWRWERLLFAGLMLVHGEYFLSSELQARHTLSGQHAFCKRIQFISVNEVLIIVTPISFLAITSRMF